MTQALALADHLRDAGHELTRVLVGRSALRPLPDYFRRGIGAPVEGFEAPMLVPERRRVGMSGLRTAIHSVRGLPAFTGSVLRLRRTLGKRDADVVVNFYDLLAGVSRLLKARPIPTVSVAHSYLLGHPGSAPAPSGALGRWGLRHLSALTAARSTAVLALSFDEWTGRATGRVRIVPPLLRRDLGRVAPSEGSHLLVYALNPGFGEEVAEWHRRNTTARVHCFIEGGAASVGSSPGHGLEFHELDDRAFLESLAGCRAYVGTAGFESLCEAHWLGKPVLAVPTAGHYEQRYNAADAERAGVARAGTLGDLDAFWNAPRRPHPVAVERFRRWTARAPEVVLGAIEAAAAERR
jgi:uncharacterized protein (TIGR00661 family)